MSFLLERIDNKLWLFRLRGVAGVFSERSGVSMVDAWKQPTVCCRYIFSLSWLKEETLKNWCPSDEIGSDVNECDLLVLCKDVCRHWETLQSWLTEVSQWAVRGIKATHTSKSHSSFRGDKWILNCIFVLRWNSHNTKSTIFEWAIPWHLVWPQWYTNHHLCPVPKHLRHPKTKPCSH